MGVYGYSFNNPMYPSGYGAGYGGGFAYSGAPVATVQVTNTYSTTLTQPYMGGGLGYPQGQIGFSNPGMSMPQLSVLQSPSFVSTPFSSVTYPAASGYYTAPAMATQMPGYGANYGVVQQPLGGAGFNVGASYPAALQGGMNNPFMQTASLQMPQSSGAAAYNTGGYPAAQAGLNTSLAMQQPNNMLQMMNPAYSSGSYGSGNMGLAYPQQQTANPFMQAANLAMPQTSMPHSGMPIDMMPMGSGSGSLPSANQLPTREELLQLLQYVDVLNGEPGRDDALIYGLDSSQFDPQAGGQYDPSMMDPSMMDPSMVDPSMVDPSMVDPSMVDPSMVDPSMVDPSMVDPSMVDPSLMDPSMGGGFDPQSPYYGSPSMQRQGAYGGYQARYGDPSRYDSAFARPGQLSPSLYNSSPLSQAVAQFRDTMKPEFSMNGQLTQDAQDQKDTEKNKSGNSGSSGTPAAGTS